MSFDNSRSWDSPQTRRNFVNSQNGNLTKDLLHIDNFIGGEFMETERYLDSYDPSKDKVWATVPDSNADDVNIAVKAGKLALKNWSQTCVQERSAVMMKIADLLELNLEVFAEMESRDQGKPIETARTIDIPRAIHNFRFFASGILHQTGLSTYQENYHAVNFTTRSPVGVAALISPWNLPLYLLTFKLAPAIACGNTVVCKPSEMTSVTAWMLCKIMNEAGLPAGVVNMVFGLGPRAGDALVRHPDITAISFTGSTATAEKIRMACANQCKKLSLELGGKNAAIIFDDADLEKCIPTVTRSSFVNQGEVCLCTSRIFVHEKIFDTFMAKFVESCRKITVGDPRSSDTWMGALVSKDHKDKVTSYIRLAQEEGATIATGNEAGRLNLSADLAKGYFVPPTVITGVSDYSRLMQEEIFGPVTCVVPFNNEDEVVSRANNVTYGLCASVWSRDLSRVHRMAQSLEVGTVWANCWLIRDLHMPFGGIKSSGIGREGFHDSFNFYTEVKTVCMQFDPSATQNEI